MRGAPVVPRRGEFGSESDIWATFEIYRPGEGAASPRGSIASKAMNTLIFAASRADHPVTGRSDPDPANRRPWLRAQQSVRPGPPRPTPGLRACARAARLA